MRETVSTMELRRRLGEILDRVALRQDQFIIARKGRPLAVVVPVETHDQLLRAARLHLLDTLDRPRRTKVPQRQADAVADEAKHAVRRKGERGSR